MTLRVTAYTGLGPGAHDVVVTGLEQKTSEKFGGYYLRWEFSDAEGNTATANSDAAMTPGNKTGKWFAALTGKPTEVDTDRKLAEVIGRPASIFIEEQANGFPKVISVTGREAGKGRKVTPALEEEQKATDTAEGQLHDDPLPF